LQEAIAAHRRKTAACNAQVNGDLGKEAWSMIDSTVQQLLEEVIDSTIKLQLILLFHEDPRAMLNPNQVANRIYRDIWSIRDALRELHRDGVLASDGATDPHYHYAPQPRHAERITHLVQQYNEPFERDKIQHAVRRVASDAVYQRARSQGSAFELQSI
jgi:hypothetical protein